MRHIEDTTPIYSIYFLGDKTARKGYIGISKHPQKRQEQHKHNKEKQCFFDGCENVVFEVLESGLGYEAASQKETTLILHYLQEGWKMANNRINATPPVCTGDPNSDNDVRWRLQQHHNNIIRANEKCAFQGVPDDVLSPIIEERIAEIADKWECSEQYAESLQTHFRDKNVEAMSDKEFWQEMESYYDSECFAIASCNFLDQ